jgi:hypothetical protein
MDMIEVAVTSFETMLALESASAGEGSGAAGEPSAPPLS